MTAPSVIVSVPIVSEWPLRLNVPSLLTITVFASGIWLFCVNVTVAAALVSYVLSGAAQASARMPVWAVLAGVATVLLLSAEWVLAVRARADHHLTLLLLLAAAEYATLLACLALVGAMGGIKGVFGTVAALSAMIWIAGPGGMTAADMGTTSVAPLAASRTMICP